MIKQAARMSAPVITLIGLLVAGDAASQPSLTPEAAAGQRLAQRSCAECHAVRAGQPSPLAEAPAFPTLYTRFNVDSLAAAFERGVMIGHPRMPLVRFDVDEIGYLTAFLKSFILPGETGSARPICEPAQCAR